MVWPKPQYKAAAEFVDPEFHRYFYPRHHLNFNSLWIMQFKDHHRVEYPSPGSNLINRFDIDHTDGKQAYYLKRQLERVRRNIYSPMGESHFAQELRNMLLCQEKDIPCLEPVYYCQHQTEGGLGAILIIRALDGYRSLLELLASWQSIDSIDQAKILTATALMLARMHNTGFRQKQITAENFIIDLQQIPQVRQANPADLSRARMNERRCLEELKRLMQSFSALALSQQQEFIEAYCQARPMRNSPMAVLRHCLNSQD